ncbi:MAG TPA: alpha/beta fold hydrolase [Pseudogracilibacillus sp.]|nr:alpha/beta fold hydrolase [Pseudogracilibacillus sp.]
MIGCLIIHGFTGGPYEVEPLHEYLRAHTDWRIEVPLLSGHGETLQLEEVTHEIWLEEAEEAIQDLQETCDEIYVIGFSMGGMIASYLAAHYDVDKLVLLATARKYLSFKYLSYYVADVINDSFKGQLKENEIFTHYKSKLGAVPFKANVEFMKLVNETKRYLQQITSPVFIAQGQKDGIVPYTAAYSLEKEIGSEHKEVVIFEQSNHLICLGEDRTVLNQMVYDFLQVQEKES